MSAFAGNAPFLSLSGASIEFAINWLLQSTLLISLALLAAELLRKRGSAAQSVVYRTALVAILVCPLATWLLAQAGFSGWSIRMPVAWRPLEPEESAIPRAAEAPSIPAGPVVLAANEKTRDEEMRESPVESVLPLTPTSIEPAANQPPAVEPLPAMPINVVSLSSPRVENERASATVFGMFAAAALALWCVVSGVLLLRLARAWWSMTRLRRRAVPADATTTEVCRGLAIQMRVQAPNVECSPYVPSPCLTGLFRPTILLPEEPFELPMRDVLVHELAHLARRDCHWKLIHQLATALFFFQPLLWRLGHKIEAASEEVCDDFVVQLGNDRSSYARGLVDVAELSLAPIAAAGVGIVSLPSMLARRVSRIMDTSRSLSTRVGSVSLALVLVGGLCSTVLVGVVGLDQSSTGSATQSDGSEAATKETTPEPSEPVKSDASAENATQAEFAGAVVDPAGKPAEGASIYCVYHVPEPTGLLTPIWKPVATTDKAGSFRFTFNPRDFGVESTAYEFGFSTIIATKPGFGFAWSKALNYETTGKWLRDRRANLVNAAAEVRERTEWMLTGPEQPMKLVPDDEPIRGRIADINGQPIAGARVTLINVSCAKQDDLTGWNKSALEPKADYYSAREQTPIFLGGPQVRSLMPVATTNADGAFDLKGVGRGRIARLLIQGPGMESALVFARTEKGEMIEVAESRRSPELGKHRYYPAEFLFVAGPSAPIVGVVRDETTKEPLAGVTVKSQRRHGQLLNGWGQDFVRAVSNEKGEYRLEGMPIGSDNRIAAIAPTSEIPYFSKILPAPTEPGGPRKLLDFELRRGVWVEIDVTDKTTGKGLPGIVNYFVPKENKDYSFAKTLDADERDRLLTDENGRLRLAVLPGKGFVTFMAHGNKEYPRARSLLKPDGRDVKLPSEMMETQPSYLIPTNFHVVAEINVSENGRPMTLELKLDSGVRLAGQVVDPDGQPLSDFKYSGRLAEFGTWDSAQGDRFELIGYDGTAPRNVYIAHANRMLAGHVPLQGKSPENLTVKLEPAGSVKGRLVDVDGSPLANFQVAQWNPKSAMLDSNPTPPLPPNSPFNTVGEYETDGDGRFEIRCLIPGLDYRLYAFDRDSMTPVRGRIPKVSGPVDVVIHLAPGETKDLGDVRLKDKATASKDETENTPAIAQPEEPKTATGNAENMEVAKPAKEVRGMVVGADGKPVGGAQFYWFYSRVHDLDPMTPRLIARSEENGTFHFPPPVIELSNDAPARWEYSARLVVTAPGHGFSYTSVDQLQRNFFGRVVLPAVGMPIRGRLLDIDGRPIVGATVRTRWFKDLAQRARTPIPADSKGNDLWRQWVGELLSVIEPAPLRDVLPQAKTDADGWFTLEHIGKNHLVQLLVEAPGFETAEILAHNESAESIKLPEDRNSTTNGKTVFGTEFTQAMGPSRPVEGKVFDLDAQVPIAGAVVRAYKVHGSSLHSSREMEHFATRTDADGRYRITGLPIGKENVLVAFTTSDVPYLPAGHAVDTSSRKESTNQDFSLRRGVWAEGRVFDAKSQKPFTGEMSYYFFRAPDLKATYPGIYDAFVDGLYWTNLKGEFRVPVLPSRGILAYRYDGSAFDRDGIDRYRRGYGADGIEGRTKMGYETEPHYLLPQNYERVAEVAPTPGQTVVRVDMPLVPSSPVKVLMVDASGSPVANTIVYGVNERFGWQRMASPEFEILDLGPSETRKVFALHHARNLAGGAIVKDGLTEPLRIVLKPAGSISGRLVDGTGLPITDASLFPNYEKFKSDADAALWVVDSKSGGHESHVRVDKEGRFRIDGLAPDWKYHAHASAPRTFKGSVTDLVIGSPLSDVTVAPGEAKDLGDLAASSRNDTLTGSVQANVATLTLNPILKLSGAVLDANDRPVANANVAVVAQEVASRKGVILAEVTTNPDGKFRLEFNHVPPQTHSFPHLIARKEGAALAWEKISLDAGEANVVLKLAPELVLRGRLVDIDGQSVVGAEPSVRAVVERVEGEKLPSLGVGYQGEIMPRSWPVVTKTDEQGRFAIHGIPSHCGVYLEIAGNERYAHQDILLNSGTPEQRGERDGTYRALVKNVKPEEEALLPLAPAQIFEGTVRFADTGEPAPHARLSVWASQQQFGSMVSVETKTDGQGRYRIHPKPGIRFGVIAHAPSGTPYLASKTPFGKSIEWNAGDRVRNVDVALRRGVLVRGRVTAAGSNSPIANASVQYIPEEQNNLHVKDDILTGWQAIERSDEDGKFAIAVLPGPGRLLVHGLGNQFILTEIGASELRSGKPGGTRNYANAILKIEPKVDAEPLEIDVSLRPGESITGTLVDERDAKIAEALVISGFNISPTSLTWRGHTFPTLGGRFQFQGLEPGKPYPVYVLDAKNRLGATLAVEAGMNPPTVVLRPCGEASARFVDLEGKPLKGHRPLIKMVFRPGVDETNFDEQKLGALAADSDFVGNIDQINYWPGLAADADGRIKLPALIPGATYRLLIAKNGRPFIAKEFTVESGQTLDLGEFSL